MIKLNALIFYVVMFCIDVENKPVKINTVYVCIFLIDDDRTEEMKFFVENAKLEVFVPNKHSNRYSLFSKKEDEFFDLDEESIQPIDL